MADIEKVRSRNPNKKFAFIKNDTRVDLTPMVDLGFLLITFFVFTTTLSLPTVMSLKMPYDKVPPGDVICESCVLTVLLTKDNTIQYYEGMADTNPLVKKTVFGSNGIRNIILEKRKAVENITGSPDDFVLIIKPTDESTFQDFVDIVDEVVINNVKHYYTSEIDKMEWNNLLKVIN